MRSKSVNNLITVDFEVEHVRVNSVIQTDNYSKSSFELWHERLGHIGKNEFLELSSKEMTSDVELVNKIIQQMITYVKLV